MLTRTMRIGMLAVTTVSGHAWAQPATSFQGLDFLHVGDAGNRAPLPSETRGFNNFTTWGAVGYEYGIMETEVTLSQYAEFITAYLPHHQPIPNESLSGTRDLLRRDSNGVWTPFAGTEMLPARTTWIMAARFANWIHNGKSDEAAAFSSGAYNLSPDRFTVWFHTALADIDRSPGARVALPTSDEWAKATYYDPNRYGPGEGGYWIEPGSSDNVLITGRPGEPHAQTSRGLVAYDPRFEYGADVISYPQTRSPWGLADVSGSWREALEWSQISSTGYVALAGSDMSGIYWDSIDEAMYNVSVLERQVGIRLVRVPSPSTPLLACCALIFAARRRR